MPGNYYVRHVLGMLLVGVIMYVMMRATGHYYIEGVGYATVQDVLSGAGNGIYLLLLLFVLKLFVTSVTLGSGASGGIFSPALFLGATLGGAYGLGLSYLFPHISISPPAFAVAGMAGVVAGSTGAAMAAIVMIFEMTRDYNVIIPMTITVALSYGIRKVLSRDSIYTLKLVRRAHYIPEMLHANVHYLTRAAGAVQECQVLAAQQPLEDLAPTGTRPGKGAWHVVAEGTKIIGVVSKEMLYDAALHATPKMTLGEIARRDFAAMPETATLYSVLMRLSCQMAPVALIVEDKDAPSTTSLRGIITKERIVESMTGAVELCSLWSE